MNRITSDPRQATVRNHTETRDEALAYDASRTIANPRVTSTDFRQLPFEHDALNKPRYDSFTCSLKCYGKDFDRTMPYALKDRLTKDEFRSHIEKVNGMMRERPRELEGYARECDRKRRAWATAAIVTDIVVFVSAVCFLLSFIAFGIVLGFAVGDITTTSWWWAVVLTAALWAFFCFVLTISTIIAVYCHQKWRTWTKVTRDETTLEKYHAIIRYLRRENDRYFHSKGVSFELNVERGLPRQHYAGWSVHHHPTLDVHVYHRAFVVEPAIEKTISQHGGHITTSSRPVNVLRKETPYIGGTSSRQAQAQDEATGVMQSFNRNVDKEGLDDDAIVP